MIYTFHIYELLNALQFDFHVLNFSTLQSINALSYN